MLSDSLKPHGLQHARFPCPSLSPGVCSTHLHCVNDAIQQSHPLISSISQFICASISELLTIVNNAAMNIGENAYLFKFCFLYKNLQKWNCWVI